MKRSIKKIGVVGTGFIARGFVLAVEDAEDFEVSKVLTRRNINNCREFPRGDLLTNSIDELIDHSDVIVESSGDAVHATEVIDRALQANLPVVTMDTEFHVTTGSYFVGKGIITEAGGDQPGCLAALHEDALEMGFKPLVYGNVKGFYNPKPTLEDMQFWSKKHGISLEITTAATDGTKLQCEQALVANGLKVGIVKPKSLAMRSAITLPNNPAPTIR